LETVICLEGIFDEMKVIRFHSKGDLRSFLTRWKSTGITSSGAGTIRVNYR